MVHQGIVVQWIEPKCKITLLDKQQGRIDGVIALSSLCVGSLISYTVRVDRATSFIEDTQLLYVPLSLACIDLLFLHHVLELIYYWIPPASCISGVFDLIAYLYMTECKLATTQYKKFFLLKLLTLLGLLHDHVYIHTARIDQLAKIDIHLFDPLMMDNACEKELDIWLRYCIWLHPYGKKFKTVHFLDQNRAL